MKEAILILSFGGPEGPDEVMPFLERVTRGRNIPRERLLEVAGHYHHFGGRSPINDQNRALIRDLEAQIAQDGPRLPVYWGNRNWHPLIEDTVARMKADGIEKAWAFATSAFSSYSGCRQYREDIDRARAASGEGAPEITKLRVFFNHPGFLEPMVERVKTTFGLLPVEEAAGCQLVFTAHSIPVAMAETSTYVQQLVEASALVASLSGHPEHVLAYQSRSGPPTQKWLEPDLGDWLKRLAASQPANRNVVVVPIGFVSDHMEVLYDLDEEAKHLADGLGLRLIRAGTVGNHPRFVQMIRELVREQTEGREPLWLGANRPKACLPDCCPAPQRPVPVSGSR
ncbi:MAG: ferrochelatase [Bryobacteraceae bacterium]